MQIDRIDRHILTLLAADARMAVSTVAGTVGLSQSAATRRIQALEAAGMIEAMPPGRSEEHTSELQSLMRISYAVFCLKKKTRKHNTQKSTQQAQDDI